MHDRSSALLLAVAAATLVPWTASAQQPPDTTRADTTVFRVEGIRVEARRPLTTVGGAKAVEVRVERLLLPAAPSTAELFRELPTLHVRTNSRGEAEISVRGSGSRQVAVLVDGVPLTLGWDARTDVSVLPAGAVTEVSVVPGLSSILHGPNVLGGVVEMNVARGQSIPREGSLSAAAGLDHEGGYSSSVVGERPFTTLDGEGTVRVGIGHRDSPGYPLPSGVREPVPDTDGLRLNTDTNELNGFLAFRYLADAGWWGSFSAASFRAERGIAAELDAEAPRLWRYPDIARSVVAASMGSGDRDTPWGRGDVEASIGYDSGRTEIRSYASRAYDDVVGYENGDDRTLTLRLLADHTLGARADLRSSFTWADIHHDADTDGERAEYQQRLMSLAGETVVRLIEGPGGAVEGLRLSVGAAWDRGTTPKSGGLESLGTLDDWGGRVGLSALMNEGGTMLHAGVSRRGRFPSLRETYSESLDRFIPNPELGPEHLLALEAGVTTRVGEGELQIVGFRQRLTGAIRRITLDGGMRMRVNADELTSTGLELILAQGLGPVALEADATLQTVALTDPGTARSTEPENVPERAGRLAVTVPVPLGISARGEVEYTGRQFCQHPDTGADVELDAGAWLNATLSKVWNLGSAGRGRRLEARISGENLADQALYDQCGLPRAGRLFRVQVRLF